MTDGVTDYVEVSEVAGQPISREQLDRLHNRYMWARPYCVDRDVIEVACGSGPGLGLLARVARHFAAGDFSQAMVDSCYRHYGERIPLSRFDAQTMPFEDASADVVIICEALYYLPDIDRFFSECRRVLRRGGKLLVVVANKDLPDFNPSPHSYEYLGSVELAERLGDLGFSVECFGYLRVDRVSLRQRILRPVKRLAVALGLVPKTMKGKELLRRLVFGDLDPMPAELTEDISAYEAPTPISSEAPDRRHKVIYCAATVE